MTSSAARRRAPWVAAVAVALATAGGIALYAAEQRRGVQVSARPAAARPTLKLLTSLPLVFGESFSLDNGGSAALKALETRYRVEPINVADAASLRGASLLLMAQPLAQPADVLVELDAWVRAGGRLLLLADPMLEWHSERPLGDPFRPLPIFADTGLLGHWGLRLDPPDERGPKLLPIDGREIMTNSPGTLAGKGCDIDNGGLIARCVVGAGSVTVIADADFLDVERPEGLDGPTGDNLNAMLAMLAELAKLERA